MKICVAQTRPVRGGVQSNIESHKKLIELASSHGADTIIFPELSITGYEPELAQELATSQDDERFDDFQKIADAQRITIGIGMPVKGGAGICISLILFQPHQARQTFAKKYLHSDEEQYFTAGQNPTCLIDRHNRIALAICYELSIPEHSANAFRSGAKIYLASVAKTSQGVKKAAETLSDIAKRYSMTVLMANCVGPSGDGECAGRTSIWNDSGLLVRQLDDAQEGILIFDTETRETTEFSM